MEDREIQEIYDVLSSFKGALDGIISRLDAMEKSIVDHQTETAKKFEYVDNVLFDQVLNPAQEAIERAEKDLRFDEFKARQEGKFAPILENIKAIEGEDFDAMRKTFDDFETDNKGFSEDEYVEDVIKSLTEQIEKVKESFGLKEISIESKDGETKTVIDGEEVKTEETEERPEIVDVDTETSKEEIDALMKELEAYKE